MASMSSNAKKAVDEIMAIMKRFDSHLLTSFECEIERGKYNLSGDEVNQVVGYFQTAWRTVEINDKVITPFWCVKMSDRIK